MILVPVDKQDKEPDKGNHSNNAYLAGLHSMNSYYHPHKIGIYAHPHYHWFYVLDIFVMLLIRGFLDDYWGFFYAYHQRMLFYFHQPFQNHHHRIYQCYYIYYYH